MRKKIKAFTILEMIVVMALSSLVILIALMAFLILQNQFTSFQKSSDSVNKFYFFFETIDRDIEQAYAYNNSNNEFVIQKGTREIKYSFSDGLITREEMFVIDTLIKDIPQIQTEFQDLFQNEKQLDMTFYLEEDTLKYSFKYKTQI